MLEERLIQRGLRTTAPQQDGALAFEPLVSGQGGGDGFDFGGFADDEQQAGFVAPEEAVVLA